MGGEQRVGLLDGRERVAVPVGGPHIQVLARLVIGAVLGQIGGQLFQACLDCGGEPPVTVDDAVTAVGGGDPQRDQDPVRLD